MFEMITDEYEAAKQQILNARQPGYLDPTEPPPDLPPQELIDNVMRWLDDLHALTPIPKPTYTSSVFNRAIEVAWMDRSREVRLVVFPNGLQDLRRCESPTFESIYENNVSITDTAYWVGWYMEAE